MHGFDRDTAPWAAIIGEAILLASTQWAVGSVEMSSRFSVMSFAKDGQTLQRAADALRSYLIVGCIWAIGTILILHSQYGQRGLVAGIISNLIVMGWLWFSYWRTFQIASAEHGVPMPTMFDLDC